MSESNWSSFSFQMRVLDSLLNNTSDVVYVTDVEGKVQEVNKRFEEIHGWAKEEIIGKELPMSPKGLANYSDANADFTISM